MTVRNINCKRNSALSFVLALVILVSSVFTFTGCTDASEDYYAPIGWDVTTEVFENNYIPYYDKAIKLEKMSRNMECEHYFDVSDDIMRVFLFNESFTICFYFGNGQNYGEFILQLFYFGDTENPDSVNDYAAQKDLVDFAYTAIKAFGYRNMLDENPDTFKVLFDAAGELLAEKKAEEEKNEESEDSDDDTLYLPGLDGTMEEEECIATFITHSSERLVDLGYSVSRELEVSSYFYMMRKDYADPDVTYTATSYQYKGLLNKLPD